MALLRPSLFLTPRLHVERGAGYRCYSFFRESKKSLKELGCNLLCAKYVFLGGSSFNIYRTGLLHYQLPGWTENHPKQKVQ